MNKLFKFSIILAITLIILAQIISFAVFNNFKDNSIIFIPNAVDFTYVENTGGAFGIGQNDTITFIFVSIIIIGIIIHFMYSQREKNDKIASIALSFMLAGRY